MMSKKLYHWTVYFVPQKEGDLIVSNELMTMGYGWYLSEAEAKGVALTASGNRGLTSPIVCVMATEISIEFLKEGIAEYSPEPK